MIQNQSRLSELERCPRRYAWRYLYDLAPKQSSLAMERGLWLHAGLAAWYKSFDREVAIRAYEEAFRLSGLDLSLGDVREAHDTWLMRLVEYCKRQRDQQFRVLMVPEQEIIFDVGRHRLATRVDLIVQDTQSNQIWVMDHKTAERTGPSWYSKYYVDKQGSSYILAAKSELGTEPAGWLINTIKSTKADWFERQAFTRQRDQLDSFVRQTEKQLDRLEQAVVEFPSEEAKRPAYLDEHFPQYTHECHGWGTCVFISICQAGLRAAKASFKAREKDYVDDQRSAGRNLVADPSGRRNAPKEAR